MADRFDPYHKWLSIPPKDQPPNHYRLLGVELFESDAEVIEAAADRQMAHLRTYQIGKHAAESQKLLNEISAAKIILLTAERKHAYDTALRASQAPSALPRAEPIASIATKLPTPVVARPPAQAPVRVAPLPVATPLDFAETATPFQRLSAPRARPTRATWQKPAMALGVAALLGVLFLVLSKPAPDATVADREPLAKVEPKTAEAAVRDSARTNAGPAKHSAPEIEVREPDRNAKIAKADPSVVNVVISNPDTPRVDEFKSPKPASPDPSGEAQVPPSAPDDQTQKPTTGGFGLVCDRLAAKAGPTTLLDGAQAFDGPNGDGRHGAKGVLVQLPVGWQETGTSWAFDYQRVGSPFGLQIVHPFNQGQVLVSVWHDVAITTSGYWDEFGWSDPVATMPLEKSSALPTLLPIQNEPVRVISRLDSEGNYRLELNGQAVVQTKIDKAPPLNLSIRAGHKPPAVQGYGNPDFAGAGLPRALRSGEAGLLLSPLDNGSHAATNVRLEAAQAR